MKRYEFSRIFALAFWLFSAISCLTGQTKNSLPPGVAGKIDSVFSQWNAPGSPGCAVGIIRDGEFVYRHGFGYADIEHNFPITAETKFNIGSTSKQFTAACILLLAQRHKLSLDDDVHRFIPELPSYQSPITIRELLNHTSGLRDYITLLYFSGVHVEDLSSGRDALDMVLRQRDLNFAPSEEWSYSNTGYFLASVIVQRVAGKSIPEFAKENIFDPLGMHHTEWVSDAKTIVSGRAEGYSPKGGGGFQLSPSGWDQVGDGGINTTVDDLLLWDRNFYNPTVGNADLIREMTTPGRLKDGTSIVYGLGYFLEKYRGLSVVRHEGEWAGYKAEMMRFPERRLTVICLCNLSSMVPTLLARKVADICLAKEMPAQPAVAGGDTVAHDSVTAVTESLSSFPGYYRNPSDETIRKIVVHDGKLFYARIPGAETPLKPVGPSSFKMLGVPGTVIVRFSPGPYSTPIAMSVIVDSAKPISFVRFDPVVLTKNDLAEYAGDYYSEELDAKYAIAAGDSQLVVRIRRFDDLPLSSTVKDVFRYQDYRVFTFKRNSDDRITGFILTSGRARNLTFSKVVLPSGERREG